MYQSNIFKYMRAIIPETLASTDSTSFDLSSLNSTSLCTPMSTKKFGTWFEATIKATTGDLYVSPNDEAEPTSSNAIKLSEGEILDVRIKTSMSIRGDSTTAKFQAIIWGDGNK